MKRPILVTALLVSTVVCLLLSATVSGLLLHLALFGSTGFVIST